MLPTEFSQHKLKRRSKTSQRISHTRVRSYFSIRSHADRPRCLELLPRHVRYKDGDGITPIRRSISDGNVRSQRNRSTTLHQRLPKPIPQSITNTQGEKATVHILPCDVQSN